MFGHFTTLCMKGLSKNKKNLSKEDCQALKKMKNNESIVIKEADKGGAVVIMDSVYYEQIIYKQLEDKNTYKKSGSILWQ